LARISGLLPVCAANGEVARRGLAP
jgi:hypothetical protein